MNFVPKIPAAGALQEVFSDLAAPAVVLDAEAGALMAGNAAGLALWGYERDQLPITALDRAMPGLVRLRQRMDNAPEEDAGQPLLAFWTPRGLLCLPCSSRHLPPVHGFTAYLVVWSEQGAPDAEAGPKTVDEARSGLASSLSESHSLGLIARRVREKSLTQFALAGAARTATTITTLGRGGDPLANLAHELRTPLAAVIALAEIMTEEHLGPLPNERYRGYIRDIRDSARHGLGLVDSLLVRDDATDGEIELIWSEVDINETVRSCVSTMQPLASKSDIALGSRLQDDLPRVVADARCVKQILLNLLSNSVKYAGRGAEITVRTAYALAGPVWIEVVDNGPGIAPEIADSALDDVARPAAAREHTSTGLGLPLSRRLARANGARLEIDSGIGVGAVVRVVFAKDRIVPV